MRPVRGRGGRERVLYEGQEQISSDKKNPIFANSTEILRKFFLQKKIAPETKSP
jgi:hypothetical protein